MQDISLLLWLFPDITYCIIHIELYIFNCMPIFTYFCIYLYSSFLHLLKATQGWKWPHDLLALKPSLVFSLSGVYKRGHDMDFVSF